MAQTVTPEQQKTANRVARAARCGRATTIILSADCKEPRVVSHTPYGYRKRTTGEYVPNRYLANFGWKNTYYQNAETVVELPA